MKYKYSAILWREFNKDIKSYSTLISCFSICILIIIFYEKFGQLTDSFYYVAISILIISFYNSRYFMNNITTVLCLPIQMGDFCIGRTLYKTFRLCFWIFFYTILVIVTYKTRIIISIEMVIKITISLFTLISFTYFFEYLILIAGKRLFSIIIILQTYLLSIIKYLIFTDNLFTNILLIIIDLIIVTMIHRKCETIDLEKITRRWI
jgi:hypothetical protein